MRSVHAAAAAATAAAGTQLLDGVDVEDSKAENRVPSVSRGSARVPSAAMTAKDMHELETDNTR